MKRYSNISDLYDVVYLDRVDDVRFYVEVVDRSVKEHGAIDILEIGTGTGRVLLPLAERYPETSFTALDIDKQSLDSLRAKLAYRNLRNVDPVLLDLGGITWHERFDVVLAPFRVLQHQLSTEELGNALALIWTALKPGASVVFDLFNPSIPLLAALGLRSSQDFVDEWGTKISRKVYATGYSYFEQVQHIEERYRISDPEGSAYEINWAYDSRFFFRGEVEPLLVRQGFEVDQVDGDFNRTPFGQGEYPGDLVFSASKPR